MLQPSFLSPCNRHLPIILTATETFSSHHSATWDLPSSIVTCLQPILDSSMQCILLSSSTQIYAMLHIRNIHTVPPTLLPGSQMDSKSCLSPEGQRCSFTLPATTCCPPTTLLTPGTQPTWRHWETCCAHSSDRRLRLCLKL